MKNTIKKEVEVDLKTLKVRAGVRYWEDSSVNEVEDAEGELIPCRVDDDWCPLIDIETGKITNWEEGKTADIHYKVCDDGDYYLLDAEGVEQIHLEGYVPDTLAIEGSGYGDYIILKVDSDGMINNWNFDVNDFLTDND